MTVHSSHISTAIGTTGGTLLTVFANVHSEDVLKTVVLGCIGATVSFTLSLVLKWIAKKIRSRSN